MVCRGSQRGRRRVAWVALASLIFATCSTHKWEVSPLTEIDVQKTTAARRTVRLHTPDGPVEMALRRLAFPFVEGVPVGGTGLVDLDLRPVTAFTVVVKKKSHETRTSKKATEDAFRAAGLPTQVVRFDTPEGFVTLDVERLDYPLVRGRPRDNDATGLVRVDLRSVTKLEVRSRDTAKTIFLALGVAAGVFVVAAIIAALTKESCPFVYVDGGKGFELVGEAYPGAAFRSIQRADLLPLPPSSSSHLRVRLRNEAPETQYTDRAALVLVDHDPALRALASVDGRVLLVGAPQTAVAARDLEGRDARALVAERDDRLLQTDLARVAAAAPRPTVEGVEATFPAPDGEAVLEIVGGNTHWLDVVFGRFFAAMGDRLATYLAAGNDPTARERIQGWRQREGVDLRVEALDGGVWRQVAVVPTTGPAALRHVAVPLPRSAASGGVVRVRLQSGPGFWRIDRLAVSNVAGVPVMRELLPVEARGSSGADQREILTEADGRYDVLEEMDASLDLRFELPPAGAGRARSLFLLTNGYYNVHTPAQSRFAPGTLLAIRNEPGAFGRFSLDLAGEYLRLAEATPRASEVQ
jgi:hypothetical protein